MASEPTLSSLAALAAAASGTATPSSDTDMIGETSTKTKEQLRRHYIRALHKVIDESDIGVLSDVWSSGVYDALFEVVIPRLRTSITNLAELMGIVESTCYCRGPRRPYPTYCLIRCQDHGLKLAEFCHVDDSRSECLWVVL